MKYKDFTTNQIQEMSLGCSVDSDLLFRVFLFLFLFYLPAALLLS